MKERIFNRAKVWGFVCEVNSRGTCQILPQEQKQTWKLMLTGEARWLLIVGDVPQVILQPTEVIAFLERRRGIKK